MSITTIIIVLVVGFVGIYFLSTFLKINKIKIPNIFKRKTKIDKGKSAEDKFKEIIPKEPKSKDKEKPKENFKPVIKESAKEEKKDGGINKTSHVSKITADDFKKNNIEVPESLGGKKKEIEKPQKRIDKNGFDFKDLDDKFNFDPDMFTMPNSESDSYRNLFDDPGFSFDDGSPILPVKDNKSDFEDLPFSEEEISRLLEQDSHHDFKDNSTNFEKNDLETNAEFDDAFHQVFGNLDLSNLSNEAREIIIGDILASPKSRTRRGANNKRKVQY